MKFATIEMGRKYPKKEFRLYNNCIFGTQQDK